MSKNNRNSTFIIILLFLIFLSACQQTPVTEPKLSLPPGWHEAEVLLPGFDKPQKVVYEIIGGEAIFEGDIILGKVDAEGNLIQNDLQSQGIVKDSGRWSGGIIPFVINSNVTTAGVQHINEAIAHWEQQTPINFVPRTSQANYIEFVRGNSEGACSSSIGRVGGRQVLRLTPTGDCGRGTLIHEIGHAVGLYHEQSREDRDSHVKILTANIITEPDDRRPNFAKRVSGATDIGAYDFTSIMHYGCTAFGKEVNGVTLTTIVPIDPPPGVSCTAAGMNRIGQRTGLSQGDNTAILTIYPIVKHPRFLEDVNGDSKKDVVAFGNDGVYVSLSTGSSFTAPSRWVANYSHNNGRWLSEKHLRLLGDINGDGKQDIVGFGDAGVYTSLSTGSSFGQLSFVVSEFGYNQGWRIENHPRFLADVNSDGKQDIVGFANEGVYVSLSTSTVTAPGFTPASRWLEEFGVNQGWQVAKHPRYLADINEDGKQDIVGFGDDGVWVALSTASGFSPASFVLNEFGFNQGWRVGSHPRFIADINGDGGQDVLGFGDEGTWAALSIGSGFGRVNLVLADFGVNQGWQVTKHPRFLANINGAGGQDVVGFGNAGVFWAQPNSDGFFGQVTFGIADFAYDSGWRVAKHPRFLADINGDGRQDVVGFGDAGVWTALSTGSGFSQANFVLAKYGYNDGWR